MFVPLCDTPSQNNKMIFTYIKCKVEFTKIKKKAFFLIVIRFISHKYITFAQNFESARKMRTKLIQIINKNKLL